MTNNNVLFWFMKFFTIISKKKCSTFYFMTYSCQLYFKLLPQNKCGYQLHTKNKIIYSIICILYINTNNTNYYNIT